MALMALSKKSANSRRSTPQHCDVHRGGMPWLHPITAKEVFDQMSLDAWTRTLPLMGDGPPQWRAPPPLPLNRGCGTRVNGRTANAGALHFSAEDKKCDGVTLGPKPFIRLYATTLISLFCRSQCCNFFCRRRLRHSSRHPHAQLLRPAPRHPCLCTTAQQHRAEHGGADGGLSAAAAVRPRGGPRAPPKRAPLSLQRVLGGGGGLQLGCRIRRQEPCVGGHAAGTFCPGARHFAVPFSFR